MSFFDSKAFNPNVFLKYKETIKNPNVDRLIKAKVFVGDPTLPQALADGVGGNYMTRVLKGILSGTPETYDGSTNLTASTPNTYKQGIVVVGRGHGFVERDFSYDLTKHDFMGDVARGLVQYWDNVDQNILLNVLKGIFGSALQDKIVQKTIANLSVADIIDGLALNGDQANSIKVVAMHSRIAFALQKANLLESLKYTDKDGAVRDTGLYAWQGRLVIIDDNVGFSVSYALTADTDIVAGKVYYTLSGTTYTKVASPAKADLGTYYEKTNTYDCYLLGADSFLWQDVGAKVPVEMSRNPSTHGGEDTLWSRQRVAIAPYGVSFKANAMSGNTPTDAELATASSWELAKDANNATIELKTIPLSCIRFSETGI